MKLSIIFTAALLAAPTALINAQANSVKDYPEIERYVTGGGISASIPPMNYTADGTGLISMSADGKRIVRLDIKTGKEVETLMDLNNTRETTLSHIEGFKLCDNGSKILVWNGKEMVYRRSYTARYYVYELRRNIRASNRRFSRLTAE